jgi:hypothetical protein
MMMMSKQQRSDVLLVSFVGFQMTIKKMRIAQQQKNEADGAERMMKD